MNRAQHIVVVDDEAPMRDMVGDYLKLHGFRVTLCEGGASLRKTITQEMPDLIVLDLNMQEEDGLSIIRSLRQQASMVPIIMFSATASTIDRVVGLEIGADDYLAKGTDLRELLARIRTVLRRVTPASVPAQPAASPALPHASVASNVNRPPQSLEQIRVGNKWLDLEAQVLRDDQGMEHGLVGTEFALLKAFAENPRRVLTRERLLNIAGARDDAFDRSIDVRINRIRKKIDADADKPSVIRTVRGSGYMFVPDDES